ncbi:MAG: hypothetical protein ACRC0Y_11145 [Fusobacteriaceae bacterium]
MFSKEIINLGVMNTPISDIPNARDFVFDFDFSNVNFIRVDIMNRARVQGCNTLIVPTDLRNSFNSTSELVNLNNINTLVTDTPIAIRLSTVQNLNIEHSFYFDIINNKILLNLRFVPPGVPPNQQSALCAFADYTFRGTP